jgi:hypothetical protein
MKPLSSILFCLATTMLLIACGGANKADKIDTGKIVIRIPLTPPLPPSLVRKDDSVKITALVRSLYKWHETAPRPDGFVPLKKNPVFTLNTSMDLAANNKAIKELKETGLFAEDFLNDYRNIAVRMDKELRDGSSLWPDGELPTFNDDVDGWCNCQDNPDNYWEKLTITNLKINKGEADFKWTWGDNFFYHTKAKNMAGTWKISYLEGFDMNYYNWEWQKKHK